MSSHNKFVEYSTAFTKLPYCEFADELVQSPNDHRKHKLIKLPNNMIVLCTSDPDASKAAASLSVNVGSFVDPPEFQGLAHFLEHAIHLGSTKYPGANEYQTFIQSNQGYMNAETCKERTGYHFTISPNAFAEALDRFAQLFISPLFDRDRVEKELQTLDKLNVYEEVISLFKKYYSADIMKLAIVSNHSMDNLVEWAVAKFSSYYMAKEHMCVYDGPAITGFMNNLDGFFLTLNTPKNTVKYTHQSKHFDVPYSMTSFDAQQITIEHFKLPPPNKYIPESPAVLNDHIGNVSVDEMTKSAASVKKFNPVMQEGAHLWEKIYSGSYEFDVREKEAAALQSITKGYLVEVWDRYFSPKTYTRVDLQSWVNPPSVDELRKKLSSPDAHPDHLQTPDGRIIIDDVKQFQATQKVFAMETPEAAAAQRIASDVYEAWKCAETSTAYISTYISEYLGDEAGIIRRLNAFEHDSSATASSLLKTLQWREENKVYPKTKSMDGSGLVLDGRGRVMVRSRQASLLPRSGSHQKELGRSEREYLARGIETLEDARLALKAVYKQLHNPLCQAAIVVPVESVRLAQLTAKGLNRIADVARAHYPGTVGQVYITASSSVLLEHARQSLQPAMRHVESGWRQEKIEFVLEEQLYAASVELSQYAARTARLESAKQALLPLKRHLDGFVRQASSIYSGEADTEADDFHSARSDTHTESEVSDTTLTSKSSAMTPVQLASLQRAVQSVQNMLRSINDSIVSDDSRISLAATKSKLAQQADVLMSTVAALNFGVSMMGNHAATSMHSPPPVRAFVLSASNRNEKQSSLAQILVLPLALLFGRPRDVLRMLRALLSKAIRVVARRLRHLPKFQTLLLLAYKHFRIYAMIFWTGALLAWQANAAIIWSNLRLPWQRGLVF
ncbi:metalloprotease [Coemansia sp. RSA 2336]|nr:metalloprotease [Coemansia sp. RSA 2336]